MATIIDTYMNYIIYFNDEALYDAAIALAGQNWLKICPIDAAALFGFTYPTAGGSLDDTPVGYYFLANEPNPGQEFRMPGPTGVFCDASVLTSPVIPSQAGVPASIWPASDKSFTFTWVANLMLNHGAGISTGGDTPTTPIAQRRWITGFEHPYETPLVNGNKLSRAFSRTIDGYGWGTRGNNNNGTLTRQTNELRTVSSSTSWERLYIRVRRLPSVNTSGIWTQHGNLQLVAAMSLQLTTAGSIIAVDTDTGGTETVEGTVFSPTIDQWYKLDILVKVSNIAGGTSLRVYVDGVSAFGPSNSFTSANTVHTDSTIGNFKSVDAECEVDFDDWISADLPANFTSALGEPNPPYYDFGIDFLLGSHVRYQAVKSVTSKVGWVEDAGAQGVCNQLHAAAGKLGTSDISSVTSGAIVEVLTDALTLEEQDTVFPTLGAVAAQITIYGQSSDGSDGTLGYKRAGIGAVNATINQTVAAGFQSAAYLPQSMIVPDEISPWSILHTKSATGGTDVTNMLATTIEYLGVWGEEDDSSLVFPLNRVDTLHNARYGNTSYGYYGAQPLADVYAVGGTYTGNGTYQEITLPSACHWLIIRPLTGAAGGIKVFGPSFGVHTGQSGQSIPNVRLWYDWDNELFKFSVVGAASSECNVSGTVYQYIAFCDPGMRFCIGGCFGHGPSTSTPKINPLMSPSFTPELGFFGLDFVGVTATDGGFIRGPNSAANVGTPYGGGTDANVANFTQGIINSFSSIHSGNGNTSYCLFRTTDSGPSGGCTSNVMVQICTYTGNGTNPRNITLTPTSGRFPLFVLVVPATNGSINVKYRDPSHTGTQSSAFNTGVIAAVDGITAVAIDQITVGSQLNSNTVPYFVFTICGDTAGMNNGTYYPTYCGATSDAYETPALPNGDVIIIGEGGLTFDGTAALTLLLNPSGIYTLVPGQAYDKLIDRLTSSTVNVKIPNPVWKTGYLGG